MNKTIPLAVLFTVCFSLAACDINEGGPEELGEDVEEAFDDAANSVEDACEEAKESLDADNTNC